MGKGVNKCLACDKNLGNGDSIRFREIDGLQVMVCSKDDKIILTFLKKFKDEFDTLNQTAHYIKYPTIIFMLTDVQYHEFEGFLSTLQDIYENA